jgi:Arc/MetJ family transcription regulator
MGDMKTTIEITDSLLAEAKECARSRGLTFRQIVEEGLRTVVEKSKAPTGKWVLRDCSFGGLKTVRDLPWHEVRRLVNEGRGE